MEVIKSGDALEKQVLEDARTKASHLLAEAERECDAIREEWRRRTEAEIRKMQQNRETRIEAIRSELAASLPLDFMRARLSYMQEALDSALREFFSRLSAKDLATIIGNLLKRMPPVFRDTTAVVFASGLALNEARKIVEENVPGVTVQDVKEMAQGQPGDRRDVGLVLETTDRRIRFRGTMRELSTQLLEQNREELAEALLGRDV
jgi:vacuolar-type H+-ATPase subunit E/Vma4